ncbi:MAG TPA: hypothetical protein VM010_03200 [Chitinophagaceae bacterium]|nr:hypothetical protein [Chitinophagaceae bacterium]
MKNLLFFTCFFMLFCCLPVQAQKQMSVTVATDKSTILIGEPVQLTIEATFSKAHVPLFFQIDSLEHFEILSRSKIDTLSTDTQIILKQVVTLTSWDSGTWQIPALSLPTEKILLTKPVAVIVSYSPMSPTQDYHDVKDIIDVTKPVRTTWYWYVIGAGLLLLLLLLVFPKKKKELVVVQKESAYKIALKDLDTLHTKTALDDTTYVTELILIFRAYLQQRHGIHSFQQTTGELGRQLEQLTWQDGDLKKLVDILQLSDYIKFAQYKATATERENAWNEIKQSIVAIEQMKK